MSGSSCAGARTTCTGLQPAVDLPADRGEPCVLRRSSTPGRDAGRRGVLALAVLRRRAAARRLGGSGGAKLPKVADAQVARARARAPSTSSCGPATPRTAATTRRSTGCTRSRSKTGCKVNVKVGNTSDEMVTLMKTGQYDGVSASGDATLRLIYGGDVAPVNTALVPNYATISDFLKNRPWNSVNGQMYGIPHGWGANVLTWNPTRCHHRADLVGRRVRPEQPVQGQGHRLRLADLHRRRRALPEGDQARPRDQQPVRAGRRRSSTPRSTC